MISWNKLDEQFMVGFNFDYGIGTFDIYIGFWSITIYWWYMLNKRRNK